MRLRRGRWRVGGWLLLAFLLGVLPGAGQSTKELARAARESVVLLKLFDAAGREVGSGTGFALGEHLLATNHHVTEDVARIQALRSDGKAVELVGVVADDETHDLALLRAPKSVKLKPLQLVGPATQVEPGDRIVLVGSPLGLAGSVSEGIVAALRPEGLGPESELFEKEPLLQITAPISPGSSGSPVLNERGEVIGVAAAFLSEGQNLNLAIPSEFVAALQKQDDGKRLLRRFSKVAEHGTLLRNGAVSLAVFAAIFLAFHLTQRKERAAQRRARTRTPGSPLRPL